MLPDPLSDLNARRAGTPEEVHTMEKDFLWNLVVVFLCAVNVSAVVASGDTAGDKTAASDEESISLYLEADGSVRCGSLDARPLPAGDIEAWLKGELAARPERPQGVSVLVVHEPMAPAGLLHPVLRAVERVPGARPLLALTAASPQPATGSVP